jgi:hypothetical protein
MPKAANKICRKPGCNTLIDKSGYCDMHKKKNVSFRKLDRKKTPEQKKFYSSGAWTKASIRQRTEHPLCERCLERGITQQAEMVHHDPELQELIRRGLNPLNPEYLHSLCNSCHLEDLRAKKNKD